MGCPSANARCTCVLLRFLSCQAKRAGIGGPPIEKEGWLEKEGAQVKNWKRRWFVLQGTSLHYFKDPGVRSGPRKAWHARVAIS